MTCSAAEIKPGQREALTRKFVAIGRKPSLYFRALYFFCAVVHF